MSLPIVAIVISAISVVVSTSTLIANSWARQRAIVLSALDALTNDSIANARSVVGTFARKQTSSSISNSDYEEFINAALRLMWAMQRAALAVKTIKNTAIAPEEARWLYHHLSIITPELSTAIKNHGHKTNWDETINATNQALSALPNDVKNSWSRKVAKKDFADLEKPSLITR